MIRLEKRLVGDELFVFKFEDSGATPIIGTKVIENWDNRPWVLQETTVYSECTDPFGRPYYKYQDTYPERYCLARSVWTLVRGMAPPIETSATGGTK